MISKLIEEVHTRGSTNRYGGLLKSMQELIMLRTCVKADVTSVLLLRDGLADVCITSTEEIVGGNEEPVRHQISCGTQCEL